MTVNDALVQVQTRSAGLRSRLAVARTLQAHSRGQNFRYATTKAGASPFAFADITALPDWLTWNQNDRNNLALASAVLYHRPSIDRELSGAKLGALADAIGRTVFEQLCSAEFGEAINPGFLSNKFPRPEDLLAIGEQLMRSSLPKAFVHTFPAASGDEKAYKLVTFAAALIACADPEMLAA